MKLHTCLSFVIYSGALACALALMQSANAQTVRLHGAVALAKTIDSKKADLETKSSVKLEIVGNGAGRGVADLSSGQADIALLAGPLKEVAAAMNNEKPGTVETVGMKETYLTSVKGAFITNPNVGLKSITHAQMCDVLTGKLTNWKELGGADLPIKVILPFGGDGTRLVFQSQVLLGADYVKNAVVRNSAKDLVVVVTQVPGACSVVSVANVESSVVSLSLEKDVIIPWTLVTKGEPAGQVKAVTEAITAVIK